MLSNFEEVDHITYCSAIPILSGFSQFCLKIPYPNQHVNQDRKNPGFDISSDIFLLMIWDRNCPLKTLEWDFRASTFQIFWGEHSPDLPGGPCLQRLHDSLVIKNYPDFTSSHGWTVSLTGTLLLFSFFKYLNSKCFFFKWWTIGFYSL